MRHVEEWIRKFCDLGLEPDTFAFYGTASLDTASEHAVSFGHDPFFFDKPNDPDVYCLADTFDKIVHAYPAQCVSGSNECLIVTIGGVSYDCSKRLPHMVKPLFSANELIAACHNINGVNILTPDTTICLKSAFNRPKDKSHIEAYRKAISRPAYCPA